MSDYAAKYSRALIPTKYATSHSTFDSIVRSIHPHAFRHKEANHRGDNTQRLVLADYLDENGRPEEAELARDLNKFIYIKDDKIHDASHLAFKIGSLKGHRYTPEERQHLETALWSSTDENSEPLDDDYDIDDIHHKTAAAMLADYYNFKAQNEHKESTDEYPTFLSQTDRAHRFWLDRESHGTGIWDHPEDYPEGVAKDLSKEAKKFGEYSLLTTPDTHEIVSGSYETP